jgi:hypothetical protein
MRRLSLMLSVAVTCLLVAAPLAAYTIYLKDGSRVIAREKYRVENGKAIIVLPSGERAALDANQIDVKRTDEANRSNYGTAIVLEQTPPPTSGAPQAAPGQRQPRLSDLIAQRKAEPRDLPTVRRDSAAPAAPSASTAGVTAPPPASAPATGALKTKAGFVDFSSLTRKPYAHLDVASELQQFFRSQGLEEVGIYGGTSSERPLVEITTNSEASVFRALSVASNALLHVRDRFPQWVSGIDLVLTTPERERAGQFALTPEMASDLASKKVEVAAFFINHVQF